MAPVVTPVAGKVKKVLKSSGETVTANEVILELEEGPGKKV